MIINGLYHFLPVAPIICNSLNSYLSYFRILYNTNGNFVSFYSKEDALDISYYPKKIHASYKMYFDDNISNVGIGLDVLMNMPCIGDFHVPYEFVFAPYSKIYYL